MGVNYHFNYIATFRKAAILFVTSSRWGGWHHVEVHDDEWWIRKYASYGFQYDHNMTLQVKQWVHQEQYNETSISYAPNGKRLNPQHLGLSIKVFLNPTVAALPQHAHLFFEHGCYSGRDREHHMTLRPCEAAKHETELPKSFLPLTIDPQSHVEWNKRIQQHIHHQQNQEKLHPSSVKQKHKHK